MNEFLDAWIAARNPAPKTIYATRRIVRRFVSLFNGPNIGEINHMHLFDFRNALAVMPEKPDLIRAGLLVQASGRPLHGHNDRHPKVAPGTVGKQLNAIQSPWEMQTQ